MEELRAQDPEAFDVKKSEQEQILQDWIKTEYPNWVVQRGGNVITIPVVVHIWDSTSTVPDARVYEQIITLNEDFRKVNADTLSGDTSSIPEIFDVVRADTEIQFCLASTDPNGNPTTGIIRQTVGGSPGGSEMWDYESYLNIFVYDLGGFALGFTQLASGNPNYAVHIDPNYFGNTSDFTYNLGRTATHEVGHWLDLNHIWGDNNCGNDQVSDTPTQEQSNYSCPSHPNITCSNDGDMFMNYMDYTDDDCMNMLTEGQKVRMIAAINNYRPGLLSSSGCSGSRVDAAFSASNTYVFEGSSTNFIDESIGIGSNWNYRWEFNGGNPSTSTDQNPTNITYDNVGHYTVVLYIDSAEVSDVEVHSYEIFVYDENTGVESDIMKVDFTVFPNPSSGKFTVTLDEGNSEIIISDITGKVILNKIITSQNVIDIDLTNESNGSYFVHIKTDNYTSVKKIQLIK